MLDLSNLFSKYKVRKLEPEDCSIILDLQRGNPLYFEYCPPQASINGIIDDLSALPPGKSKEDKYFLGFFDNNQLIAIIDLIASYPREDTVYIGLFMVDSKESGKGTGSSIIEETLRWLKLEGYSRVKLAYIKENPQSKHFWTKCGFTDTGIETDNNRGRVISLVKEL